MELSVITPAWNEELNLEPFYGALVEALEPEAISWEWIIVDDGSQDKTPREIEKLNQKDSRVKGIRHRQNQGSHGAILTGLSHGTGEAMVILSCDLQDPPQLIPTLLKLLKKSQAEIVWAARKNLKNRPYSLLAKLYFWLVFRTSQSRAELTHGADFLMIHESVQKRLFRKSHVSMDLFSELASQIKSSEVVFYEKRQRFRGQSGWTLFKKIKFTLAVLFGKKRPLKVDLQTTWGFANLNQVDYPFIGLKSDPVMKGEKLRCKPTSMKLKI